MLYDTILCDEYAMVNQEIHRNLIDALKHGARICMFGDVNQLKPIEEDRRLDDQPSAFMAALAKFGGITLDTIHRHDAGSGIARNGVPRKASPAAGTMLPAARPGRPPLEPSRNAPSTQSLPRKTVRERTRFAIEAKNFLRSYQWCVTVPPLDSPVWA